MHIIVLTSIRHSKSKEMTHKIMSSSKNFTAAYKEAQEYQNASQIPSYDIRGTTLLEIKLTHKHEKRKTATQISKSDNRAIQIQNFGNQAKENESDRRVSIQTEWSLSVQPATKGRINESHRLSQWHWYKAPCWHRQIKLQGPQHISSRGRVLAIELSVF